MGVLNIDVVQNGLKVISVQFRIISNALSALSFATHFACRSPGTSQQLPHRRHDLDRDSIVCLLGPPERLLHAAASRVLAGDADDPVHLSYLFHEITSVRPAQGGDEIRH